MNQPETELSFDPTLHDSRIGFTVEAIKQGIRDNLLCLQGKFPAVATRNDFYLALAYTVRDRLLHRWVHTASTYFERASRTVCYLSAEFLLGPHLGNNIVNLGIEDEVRQALEELELSLEDLLAQEEDPGLGNGGLGRLAACYMDSLASLEIPSIGYGIRYEFGIFDQVIQDGWQVEITDKWLRFGNPWEMVRPEISFQVQFGGHVEVHREHKGRDHRVWVPERTVRGVAHDTPILGYNVNSAALLRLWSAQACESFDFQAFNTGDYYGAVLDKVQSENITKVLYPNDVALSGKQLRLEQQFFFVSCSLQDMIRIHLQRANDLRGFHEKYAAQLNDTHPAVAVAELMRLLVDVYSFEWETAWDITQQTFGFTNHTLLPEALEKWSLDLFGRVLPRHLEIIREIDRRFLDRVRAQFPGDEARVKRMAIVDETEGRCVRMAHLACVGSHAVNGVAALHSKLLKKGMLRDFCEYEPDKYHNVTNGVTPRRFIVLANPNLARLLEEHFGDGWIKQLYDLEKLETRTEDSSFLDEWRGVKRANKVRLAGFIKDRCDIVVDPDSIFDVQAKRIHEYKRQHLNALHIITLYNRLKKNPSMEIAPRTFIFGGKAAPAYTAAKRIIKLITSIGDVVNDDPDVAGRIKVVFYPDFNVKNAQPIYPAADVSEQISTAGMEASGTGNMKFAMNGALTIGTLDGANIEIREEVGAENFFLFGLTAEEVLERRAKDYNPREIYWQSEDLKEVLGQIESGVFSRGDQELFKPLVAELKHHDYYMLMADYQAYVDCQDEVDRAYRDKTRWTRMSILNTARMGKFSSDRSISDYCRDIWNVKPVPITLEDESVRV